MEVFCLHGSRHVPNEVVADEEVPSVAATLHIDREGYAGDEREGYSLDVVDSAKQKYKESRDNPIHQRNHTNDIKLILTNT